MKRRLRAADWPLVVSALLLSLYGIAMVYSAGQVDESVRNAFVAGAWKRQLAWFVLALGGAFAVSRFSTRLIEWLAWPGSFTKFPRPGTASCESRRAPR